MKENVLCRKPGRGAVFLVLLVCVCPFISAQEDIDFNEYYKFPLSFGVEYVDVNPLSDYGFDATISEIFGNLKLPISALPQLQLALQLGLVDFSDLNRDEPELWDHQKYFALVGAGWANRFSKTFEISGELLVGASLSGYPNIDKTGITRSAWHFVASAGLRVSLNPSYNFSLDVHPSIKYNKYIGSSDLFTIFDGFTFGLGFSGHYRIGEDPDAPQGEIKSLRFTEDRLPSVFAAMQSYYVNNSIGTVQITNTEKYKLYDLEVSFFQAGFMDNPTKSASIAVIEPGEVIEVAIYASFNDNIFTKSGITPLTGKVTVDFTRNNKAVSQGSSISYDLYDKTSLTWDDDKKVGAFITFSDSALRNYSSAIIQYAKDDTLDNFSDSLQAAMQIYYALEELGIVYQVDPTSPFDAAQSNPIIVDSISIPRDTLLRLTGDCDDITVTYCALLESLGIETAFITVPGHIYAAFNTGVPSKDYKLIHSDKKMTLSINGSLWIPVEITLIGTRDFLFAWRKGVEEFNSLDKKPELRGFYKTREAQETYRPVGLQESDLGLQYGDRNQIVKNFRRDMQKLVDSILDDYQKKAEVSQRKRDFNKFGIVSAEYGRLDIAIDAFNTALSLDRNYINPKINLGSLYYLEEEYQEALRSFLSAEKTMVELGRQESSVYAKILLNIAKVYYELENFDRVDEYYSRVNNLDSSLTEQFSYLSSGNETRAADVSLFDAILFIDEE